MNLTPEEQKDFEKFLAENPNDSDQTQAEPEDKTREPVGGDISLGPPNECEDCGTNYDHITWHVDGGLVHLYANLGCFGGDTFLTEDPDEAYDFVVTIGNRFSKKDRKKTRAAAAQMRDRARTALTA